MMASQKMAQTMTSCVHRRDTESDDNIELGEVLEGGPNREAGAGNQGEKNGDVNFRRNDVFGMFGHAVLS